jgi:hypothetical protein
VTICLGTDGKLAAHWRDLLSSPPWKTELEGNLRWAGTADVAAKPAPAHEGGA